MSLRKASRRSPRRSSLGRRVAHGFEALEERMLLAGFYVANSGEFVAAILTAQTNGDSANTINLAPGLHFLTNGRRPLGGRN